MFNKSLNKDEYARSVSNLESYCPGVLSNKTFAAAPELAIGYTFVSGCNFTVPNFLIIKKHD